MPAPSTPLGALPARFRRPRVLVIGCGDVGLRTVALQPRVHWLALTSSPERRTELRARGVRPLLGNLDQPHTLARLAGLATQVLHLAPPPGEGVSDPRTQALLRNLARGRAPQALVYASTSGVYGDCGGAWVDEHRALQPQSARAQRRVDAEHGVRQYARQQGVRVSVLRVPGIYAPDRVGGTPRERLWRGDPLLRAEDDVYTNHIHADDLARACWLALWRGGALRSYHISDDSPWTMGEYYTQAAALYGLPAPERLSRAEVRARVSAMQWSFMRESRRLRNTRMKQELRLRLRYPDVLTGLRALPPASR